jgi:hypothetical protein
MIFIKFSQLIKQIKNAKYILKQNNVPVKRYPYKDEVIIRPKDPLIATVYMRTIQLKILEQQIEKICIKTN